MKARLRDIFTAVLFDAPPPEEAAILSPAERRVFENRYDVRLLSGQVGQERSCRWVYGRVDNPYRGDIFPGDYLVTSESGTRVVSGPFFDEHYEILAPD